MTLSATVFMMALGNDNSSSQDVNVLRSFGECASIKWQNLVTVLILHCDAEDEKYKILRKSNSETEIKNLEINFTILVESINVGFHFDKMRKRMREIPPEIFITM